MCTNRKALFCCARPCQFLHCIFRYAVLPLLDSSCSAVNRDTAEQNEAKQRKAVTQLPVKLLHVCPGLTSPQLARCQVNTRCRTSFAKVTRKELLAEHENAAIEVLCANEHVFLFWLSRID